MLFKYKKNTVYGKIGNRWLYPPIFDTDYLHRIKLLAVIRMLTKTFTHNTKILDVGCGWMPYKSLFKEFDYHGVDIVEHGDLPITIIGDDRKIPKPDKDFDICVCWQVLEHVENLDLFHSEIQRCLKENGILHLTTHGHFRLHSEADFWRWTQSGLKAHFEHYGWNDVSVTPIDNAVVSTTSFANSIIEKLILGNDKDKSSKILKAFYSAFACINNSLALLLLWVLPASKIELLESDSSTFIVSCKK